MPPPQAFLAAADLGTRVVVRYRIEGGLTDALGELVARTDSACTVRTRHVRRRDSPGAGGGRQGSAAAPAAPGPAGAARRRTCPPLSVANGHIGYMSIRRRNHGTCPVVATANNGHALP